MMHIRLVVAPQQMIPTFSIIHYEGELENFPRGRNKNNGMKNIITLVVGEANRDVGRLG